MPRRSRNAEGALSRTEQTETTTLRAALDEIETLRRAESPRRQRIGRRRAGDPPTQPAKAVPATPTSPPPRPEPTKEQIRRRAYEIYLARGCAPGCDIDDWLQAERELHGRP